MAISALSAGRAICELRDWKVSNLELQKILYLAHMFHLGEHEGAPLISENFEAWEYGPVVPSLYRQARGFGSGPVRNVFHWIPGVSEGSELAMLREASNATSGMSAGRLVSITHWPRGAWHKKYQPGVRGIVIPNELILEEFRERAAAPNQQNAG